MAGPNWDWLGPAVTAAVIAALVTITGWIVTQRNVLRLDRERRAEKVRDVQIAITAEIRSNISRHLDVDLDAHLAAMLARLQSEKAFVPIVPKYHASTIFDALLKEIHVLDGSVIGIVVDYYKR